MVGEDLENHINKHIRVLTSIHRMLDGDMHGVLPDGREQLYPKVNITNLLNEVLDINGTAVVLFDDYMKLADNLYEMLLMYQQEHKQHHQSWTSALFADLSCPPFNLRDV